MLITLNRPEANNSFNVSIFKSMLEPLHEAERDDRVKVIVTRAAGRHFSVGAEGSWLAGSGPQGLNETFSENTADKLGVHVGAAGAMEELGIGRWIYAVASIQKPMIASIQGAAAGGGFAIAMLHHFRIGSEKARFIAAFGKLGLGPEMGLSASLPAVVGRQRAMDILLNSPVIEGAEAHAIGLLDRLVSSGSLEEETLRYAGQLAALAPLAVRATLRQLSRTWLRDLRDQLEIEWRDQCLLFASADFREGVTAFMERRPPAFGGR